MDDTKVFDPSIAYNITTKDNPYDPFDQWDLWYDYDEQMNYHTCSVLARLTGDTSSLDVEEAALVVYDAMRELCELNPMYIMVNKRENK